MPSRALVTPGVDDEDRLQQSVRRVGPRPVLEGAREGARCARCGGGAGGQPARRWRAERPARLGERLGELGLRLATRRRSPPPAPSQIRSPRVSKVRIATLSSSPATGLA